MTSVPDLPIRSCSTLHPNAIHAFPAGGIRAIAVPRAQTLRASQAFPLEYAPHAHDYGQLLFTTRGVLVLDIDSRRWIAPPLRAIWIPPRLVHAVLAPSDVRICVLYLCAALGAQLPTQLSAMAVSPLLRELASRVDRPLDCEHAHDPLVRLCIDELQLQAQLPLALPMPSDRRLLKLCERLQREPYCDLPLETLARDAALSARHLARLFRHATGMSVAAWRQQLRLSMSLGLLADGMPVTQVAHQVGYRSPTTYAATFKRAFGVAPSQYFSAAALAPR